MVCLPVSAAVCGVRAESPTSEALHPQKPVSVQVLVHGELHSVRVHHVRPHHAQHRLPGCAGGSSCSLRMRNPIRSFSSPHHHLSPHTLKVLSFDVLLGVLFHLVKVLCGLSVSAALRPVSDV